MKYTQPLSVLLQKPGIDLCTATTEVRILQEALSETGMHIWRQVQ
jgi:hypothetical protein